MGASWHRLQLAQLATIQSESFTPVLAHLEMRGAVGGRLHLHRANRLGRPPAVEAAAQEHALRGWEEAWE